MTKEQDIINTKIGEKFPIELDPNLHLQVNVTAGKDAKERAIRLGFVFFAVEEVNTYTFYDPYHPEIDQSDYETHYLDRSFSPFELKANTFPSRVAQRIALSYQALLDRPDYDAEPTEYNNELFEIHAGTTSWEDWQDDFVQRHQKDFDKYTERNKLMDAVNNAITTRIEQNDVVVCEIEDEELINTLSSHNREKGWNQYVHTPSVNGSQLVIMLKANISEPTEIIRSRYATSTAGKSKKEQSYQIIEEPDFTAETKQIMKNLNFDLVYERGSQTIRYRLSQLLEEGAGGNGSYAMFNNPWQKVNPDESLDEDGFDSLILPRLPESVEKTKGKVYGKFFLNG